MFNLAVRTRWRQTSSFYYPLTMQIKNILIAFTVLTLASCSTWTKQDKDKFIEDCQKQKLSDRFCSCALSKAMNRYNSFDEMTKDEANMAELLYSCIEEDRKVPEDKK